MYRKSIVVLAALIVVALLPACNEKTDDEQLTDIYQITQLLSHETVAMSIYPQIWIDTTIRAPLTAKVTSGAGTITPEDYWVEIVSHKRSVASAKDSCLADEYNQDDPCKEIQIAGNGRAHVRNAQIRDSLVCRYHIINQADHSVITKDVTFSGNLWAMMAKLSPNDSPYRGWSLYAVGAQWQRGSVNASTPTLDSVVLVWSNLRYVSRAKPANHRYVPVLQLPRISPGEAVTVTAYADARDADITPIDGYIHYSINGVMKHDRMAGLGSGRFEYDLYENSAGQVGTNSQIVIELFHPLALRDSNAQVFGNVIWAITYKIIEPT
jgi:hypothetical protein